mgnify:CR=1 FL=1
MDLNLLKRRGRDEWHISPRGKMRVPGVIYGSEALIRDMDEKVYEQVTNVATLPGIVRASYAMPDAHRGYGFPIGGVAAFGLEEGVISPGGVGFDINCGVRILTTPLTRKDLQKKQELIENLFSAVPTGVGAKSTLRLAQKELAGMLSQGSKWAVKQGYGLPDDVPAADLDPADRLSQGLVTRARPAVAG